MTGPHGSVRPLPAVQDHGLGIGVIGAGYWGPNLVRAMLASTSLDLRWVCDVDLDRAQRVVGRHSTVAVTDDRDDLLDDPAVVAVAIATPAATHLDLALAAIEAGKHVLVEKPLASSVAEGRKLVEAAQDRGVVLMCDHTYCYTPAVRHLRELVATGALGEIAYIDSVRINLGLVRADCDVVWDLGPHDLSILDFVLPAHRRPVGVAALGADPVGAGHACVAYLTLPLDGGAIAHMHLNWLSPTKVRTTILGGSRQVVVWDDLDPRQRLAVFDCSVTASSPDELVDEARRERLTISYRVGDMVAPALPEIEALRTVVDEFASAITSGSPPPTDGWSGLEVLRILDAASRSLATGGALVELDPTPASTATPASTGGMVAPQEVTR